MSVADWRPSATRDALQLRAALLAETRAYFAQRAVLEVETPILAHATVTAVHLSSLQTRIAGLGDFYLQTSPEYAMKRLLAAGSGDIFQIARVFRDGERGSLHNPEFTLIEWYRLGFDSHALMDDVAQLLTRLLAPYRALGPGERLTYREAIRGITGLDPFAANDRDLLDCVQRAGVTLPEPPPEEHDDCLDLLMSTVVGPKLGTGGLTFVYEYPASQAALARLKPGDPAVAERFETYLDGIELANGFRELADSQEQRRRFEQDLELRRARGLELPSADERLLAALAAGMPECAGVAVGFDRVVMRATGARRIDEVIAFAAERA
jgi:lysyl-tRNA synthetase class 2